MTSLSIKISSLDILFSLILLEFMLLEAQALFDPDSDVTLGNKPDPTVKKTTRLRIFPKYGSGTGSATLYWCLYRTGMTALQTL